MKIYQSSMNYRLSTKTFLLSMIIIFLLGISLAAAFRYYTNQSHSQVTNQEILDNLKPVTREPSGATLNLSSPDNNLLVFDPDILIQGKTISRGLVVLSTADEDMVLPANQSGDFSIVYKLKKGLNQITITAFNKLGNSQTEERIVYYSADKL